MLATQPLPLPFAAHKARRGRAILILILLLGTALVFWDGVRKVPSGPTEGSSLHGIAATTAPSDVFRIGTFNIDGGQGLDGKTDLARTARQLEGCDFLGLQEVHGHGFFEKRDQAQILGEQLNMQWLFLPVERRYWRDNHGNAILSRLPVGRWERMPISPSTASSNRNVALVKLRTGKGLVNVLVTHLGRHEERSSELAQVLELFKALQAPAILMGDLNSTDQDPDIQELCKTPGVVDVVGVLPASETKNHIDWIFLRGLERVDGGRKNGGVSDHAFYWADVRIKL